MKRVVRKKVKRMVFNPHGGSEELANRYPDDESLRNHVQGWQNWPEYRVNKVYKKIVYMRPSVFIDAAGFGEPEPHLALMQKLRDEHIYVDVPYLIIDRDGDVLDHDGRHRAREAQRLGMKEIPVTLIYDDPRGYRKFVAENIDWYKNRQQRARKRTMLDRAVRMVRG